MTIKVFCTIPVFDGYLNNPADSFKLDVPVRILEDTGGENNGPRYADYTAEVTLAIGSTPTDVFAEVYSQILTQCANMGYDTPTKADIFAYAPRSMAELLPVSPSMT
jgi:hypothetical protein